MNNQQVQSGGNRIMRLSVFSKPKWLKRITGRFIKDALLENEDERLQEKLFLEMEEQHLESQADYHDFQRSMEAWSDEHDQQSCYDEMIVGEISAREAADEAAAQESADRFFESEFDDFDGYQDKVFV